MTRTIKGRTLCAAREPASGPVQDATIVTGGNDKSERRGPSGYRSGSAKRWRKLALEAPDLHARAAAGEFGVMEGLRLLQHRQNAEDRRHAMAATAPAGSPLEAAMSAASALNLDELRQLRVFIVAAIAAAAE